MGQAGSQPAVPALRARRAHTLPQEPLRHASKVLPSLTESPRLRTTDNGAILQSGGTISGRRPISSVQEATRTSHSHMHYNVHRSRSSGTQAEGAELRARERDPLHRSHTNLDIRANENFNAKKHFGSEPDLRVETGHPKIKNNNKNFRKKYRAPPPPVAENHDISSPDSSDGNVMIEPHRKLRLFKTRNETKTVNVHRHSRETSQKNVPYAYRSLDVNETQTIDRRYKSPLEEIHLNHFKDKDMIQSTESLKREEYLMQYKYDLRQMKPSRYSVSQTKVEKKNERNESRKSPVLDRNFRFSERFKKEDNFLLPLRREKTSDDILMVGKRNKSSSPIRENRIKSIGEQLNGDKFSHAQISSQPLRKSLPSLSQKNNEEKDEFQIELEKATSRLRNELGNKINLSETSQINNLNIHKPNPTKKVSQIKIKESSPINNINIHHDSKVMNTKIPLSRLNEANSKALAPRNRSSKSNIPIRKDRIHVTENEKTMPDRGQASGKESTPENSPKTNKKLISSPEFKKKQQAQPSKQFYFGMVENEQTDVKDNLKDFPGLGTPIIEEFSNFHLIEKKLLSYREEDFEFEKFNAKLKEDCKIQNISSESALSSGSDGEGSEASPKIAVQLRPIPPKKQPTMPRFSANVAWRQLATLDAQLLSQTQPVGVESKLSTDNSLESSPRSEPSADKSGDSGISGDHMNSEQRIESPIRHHAPDLNQAAWTPQQDLGDSSSEGICGAVSVQPSAALVTYNPTAQPFSLSLPRDCQDKGKQFQQGYNSLQKFKKSVSGAFGAARGSRRFDLEHEPILQEPEQNWFLTKSAPNSLSNPLLFQPTSKSTRNIEDKDLELSSAKPEDIASWKPGNSYLSRGGHVMYLPPAPVNLDQPLSMLGAIDRPVRSKSSGSLEVAARAARAAAFGNEMRERERSATPEVARALPARVVPSIVNRFSSNNKCRGKRFTFQSTVRQLERRKLAEKLSKEADLKEQQRRTELEAMRRVEEEFQRKRAREKASIRQQLRLVSSGSTSMPHNIHNKSRDEPDGSCRNSPAPDRIHDGKHDRHSNTSSEISGRSKSTNTPVSEWAADRGARVYRDWSATGAAGAPAIAHPPACARMPKSTHVIYNATTEVEAFSGSPKSDNYRLEFARGRSPRTPRTPRAPRMIPATRTSSSSGSELSLPQPIKIRESNEEDKEPAIVPILRPTGPTRRAVAIH